jgi:hypothetical protein
MSSRILVLLASVLVCLSAAGCGGSGSGASHDATAQSAKHDRDDDGDKNDDDAVVLDYGHAAAGTERQAIVKLVTEYYAAAAAENGAVACRLLVPFVAESVVEESGPQLNEGTCPTTMSKLFQIHHQLLSSEDSTLKFYAVRAQGAKAITVLSFAVLPEVRQITERRVGGNWRMLYLLDGILE